MDINSWYHIGEINRISRTSIKMKMNMYISIEPPMIWPWVICRLQVHALDDTDRDTCDLRSFPSRNIYRFCETTDKNINPFPTTTKVILWCNLAIPLMNRNLAPIDLVRERNPNHVFAIPNFKENFCLSTLKPHGTLIIQRHLVAWWHWQNVLMLVVSTAVANSDTSCSHAMLSLRGSG